MNTSKNNFVVWGMAVLLVVIIVFGLVYVLSQARAEKDTQISAPQNQVVQNTNAKDCTGDQCLSVEGLEYPAGKLPADVLAAVNSALDDEYKAYSVYDAVIKKIGSARPFSMIIRAEESHIASLKSILDKYGETVSANPYEGKITVKDTIRENCQIGVDAEIANVALYRDQLIPKSKAYPDITLVFNSLMSASEDKHLPAFEKCN